MIPLKFDKPLILKEIPSKNKIIIIDNYSPKYNYIIEDGKIYYAIKGKDHWVDISDNEVARNNLYNFIGNRYNFKGYEDSEKEIWELIKQGSFNYNNYITAINTPVEEIILQEIVEPIKENQPVKQTKLVTVLQPSAGGGIVNILVPETWTVNGQINPLFMGKAYQLAKEKYPDRYADPINNTLNWLPFVMIAGGKGLENMGYTPNIVNGIKNITSNIGNFTRTVGNHLSKVPQVVSQITYSTPYRKVLTNSIFGGTINSLIPYDSLIPTKEIRNKLKIKNPGDVGVVWNNILDGNFVEAREIALNGLSRIIEKSGDNNDVITELNIPGSTFNEESDYLIRPQSFVGDTILKFPSGNLNSNNFYKKNEGRAYILPESLDVNDFVFESRNRGNYEPLNTEAASITSIEPFLPYGKHNTRFKNFIGITPEGKLKVGDISNFEEGDRLAGTYANDIASFLKDENGDFIISQSIKNRNQDQPAYVLWNNGDLIEKPKGQAINLLLFRGDTKGQRYGSIAGGRVLVKVGDEIRLLSGSLKDIDLQFEDMKRRNNALYGTFYTLDNGSFNKGIRTIDEKITRDDLIAYDRLNAGGGGNFLYIKNRIRPVLKFKSDTILTPNIRTTNDESYKKGHPLVNERKGVVLHHTAFQDPNLTSVINHLTNPKSQASAHVVIGYDGTRKILATPDKVTFHAGPSIHNNRQNVNDFMIGIEFQGDTSVKDLTPLQIESAVEYLEPIIRENNIRLEDIVTHLQVRDLYNEYARKQGQKQVPKKIDINLKNYELILLKLLEKVYYKK